jgi:hypothetical protein
LLGPLAYDGSDQLVALRERWLETGISVVGGVGLATCVFATRQGLALDPARALREE